MKSNEWHKLITFIRSMRITLKGIFDYRLDLMLCLVTDYKNARFNYNPISCLTLSQPYLRPPRTKFSNCFFATPPQGRQIPNFWNVQIFKTCTSVCTNTTVNLPNFAKFKIYYSRLSYWPASSS